MIDVQEFLRDCAERFLAGRFIEIASSYATPLAIYRNGRLISYANRAEVMAGLASLRAEYARAGVSAALPQVVAQTIPRSGRIKASVDWRYDLATGDLPGTGKMTYYCRSDPSLGGPGLTIEMIEYHETIFPAREARSLPKHDNRDAASWPDITPQPKGIASHYGIKRPRRDQ